MTYPEWLIDFRGVECEIWPGDESQQDEPGQPDFLAEWGLHHADI